MAPPRGREAHDDERRPHEHGGRDARERPVPAFPERLEDVRTPPYQTIQNEARSPSRSRSLKRRAMTSASRPPMIVRTDS